MNRGRKKKEIGTAYDNRKNVRLSDMYLRMLFEIADHKGIAPETLLRSFAQDGIRREYQNVKNDPSILLA